MYNIFRYISCSFLILSQAIYSMEIKDAKDQSGASNGATNPINAQLMVETTRELVASGDLDLYELARKIITKNLTFFEELLEEFKEQNPDATPDVLKAKIKLLNEIIPIRTESLEGLVDSQRLMAIKHINAAAVERRRLIEIEKAVWKILENSINVFENASSHLKLPALLKEVMRVWVSNNANYLRSEKRIFWYENGEEAANLIAVILVIHSTWFDEKPLEFNDNDKKLLDYCHNLGKNNWFWKSLILLQGADEDSPFWLSEQDKEFFMLAEAGPESVQVQIPQELNLKSARLFSIIDAREFEKIGPENLKLLKNYSIFDGEIVEYIRKTVQQSLLSEYEKENESTKNRRKVNNKRHKKNNKKKPDNSGSKYSQNNGRQKNSHKPAMITNHNILSLPATVEIFPEECLEGFIPAKTKYKRDEEPDERVVPDILSCTINSFNFQNKTFKKFSNYEELLTYAVRRKVHFSEYSRLSTIYKSETLKYRHGDTVVNPEKDFARLRSKVKELSLQKPNGDNREKKQKQNLVTYFITIHGSNSEGKFSRKYTSDIAYSSSGFHSKKWKNAHALLSPQDEKIHSEIHPLFKNLCLKNLTANHCKNSVVGGYWLKTALHSETLFAIDFIENDLGKHLKKLFTHEGRAVIEGVTLGIYSKYDLCFRCRWLLHGMQWNLLHLLNEVIAREGLHEVTISPDLSTMIMAESSMESEKQDERNSGTILPEVFSEDMLPVLGEEFRHQMFLYKKEQS